MQEEPVLKFGNYTSYARILSIFLSPPRTLRETSSSESATISS